MFQPKPQEPLELLLPPLLLPQKTYVMASEMPFAVDHLVVVVEVVAGKAEEEVEEEEDRPLANQQPNLQCQDL